MVPNYSNYLIKITTWENDADNYNTCEVSGLSPADVKFYLKICELFRSVNNYKYDGIRFGNSDVFRRYKYELPIDACIEDHPRVNDRFRREDDFLLPVTLRDTVLAHKKIYGSVPEYWDEFTESYKSKFYEIQSNYMDLFSDLLETMGIYTWAEGEYWRVFESAKVFFVPVELVDVTEDFYVGLSSE